MSWNDTIVALATPQGIGAIGVIRLSGTDSFRIINSLFPSKDLLKEQSHTLHVGYLKNGEENLDEVVISLYKGPRSYTGEDVIEISCHGSPYVIQRIIEVCVEKGARLAKPGEFTQRAFLNGKLDLAQAEAVADLIASNTAASQRTALHTMRGGFSGKLKELRERLIRFAALIELELDFSQEDVEFADRKQFYELINELQDTTGQLTASFRLGNVIKNGVSVAIIGKPNAGKSTLLNALLEEDRAIVSDIPGTTRDTIEEIINIDGILFRLIDTAGIREHSGDVIESAGMERSKEKMKQADLVIYLFDAGDEKSKVEIKKSKSGDIVDKAIDVEVDDDILVELVRSNLNYILVGNKIDTAEYCPTTSNERTVYISAKNHQNIAELKRKMVESVLAGNVHSENTIVTNARHYQALREVEKSLTDIKTGLDKNIPGDLLALDIRRCLNFLGEITGEVSNDDMLDYIFSKFCIGK